MKTIRAISSMSKIWFEANFRGRKVMKVFLMHIPKLTKCISTFSIAAANRQDAHHQKKTFEEKYLEFLQKFEIEYDAKYLFEWYE